LREWNHIAARQQAQQALAQKETEQREILNSIMDGVITIDEASNILTFNKAAEDLFGYTAQEAIGENVLQLMPVSFRNKHSQSMGRYLKTGETHVIDVDGGVELEARRKNDSCFPIRLSIAELPKDVNGSRRFIGTCHDLTQFKQQEEQLRRSQKMDALGKLTGGIAHDYNNILGIILGYAEQIDEHQSDCDKVAKYTQVITHAALRGAKLVKKLLAFSRHKQSDVAVLNINNLLQDQRHILEKTLTAIHQISLKLDDDLWLVELDSSDLEDAIINMSINAMHAMKSGGRLTISTSNIQLNKTDVQHLGLSAGDYVLLSITDTGSGMDNFTKEKVFDPFFTTKGEDGSQVYGFVERSGGTIKVYSELGHGSRFALYFPRNIQSSTKMQGNLLDNMQKTKGGETLLVVDDEQAMVELVCDIFSTQGYRVLTANDGVQALAILENEAVDLIISDVIMPNMDGYQLMAEVQQRYPHIKLQITSGFADERHNGMIDKSLHENMLHKPYSSKTLLARVRTLLDDK
jgi:PAS domain S-box-containing protein